MEEHTYTYSHCVQVVEEKRDRMTLTFTNERTTQKKHRRALTRNASHFLPQFSPSFSLRKPVLTLHSNTFPLFHVFSLFTVEVYMLLLLLLLLL